MARQVGIGAAFPRLGSPGSRARREAIAGYVFLLPLAIGFTLFVAGPLVTSAVLPSTAFDVVFVYDDTEQATLAKPGPVWFAA